MKYRHVNGNIQENNDKGCRKNWRRNQMICLIMYAGLSTEVNMAASQKITDIKS